MKIKRVVCRLWAHRQRGGYVFRKDELTNALKQGELVEVGKISVGTRELRELVKLMPYEFCMVKSNGSLEIEAITAVWRGKAPDVKSHFEKPRRGPNASFKLNDGAWKPKTVNTTVVVKAQKY